MAGPSPLRSHRVAVGVHPLVAPLPSELQVEVTGSCNLSCRMCLVAYRPRLGRSATMSIDTFRALLDDLPTIERVTLQGLGEPLLAPDLEDMIAEAIGRGIQVGFNTNGTLLTPERSERLIALGLHWLHVSVDGARAETFAEIRRGGRLEVVVTNLRGLVSARADAAKDHPRIQLNTVVMRRNLDELEAIVRLAADIGVDRLWLQNLSHDFGDVSDDVAFVEIGGFTARERVIGTETTRRFDRVAALASELGLDVRLPGDGEVMPRAADEPGCDWPWRGVYVSHDGTVQPCCMLMGTDRGRQGTIADTPVSDLWNQPSYVELRRGLLSADPPAICGGCSAYRRTF